jgi:cytochrome P450
MKAFFERPYGFLEQCQRQHGDIFTVRLPANPPFVLVGDPDAVKQVMSGSYDTLERTADEVRFILGERSLVLLEDEPHRRTRRLMMPPWHPGEHTLHEDMQRRSAAASIEPARPGLKPRAPRTKSLPD